MEAAPLSKQYVAPKMHIGIVIERKPIQLLVLSLIVVGIGGIRRINSYILSKIKYSYYCKCKTIHTIRITR
jgi:hypothetical protein